MQHSRRLVNRNLGIFRFTSWMQAVRNNILSGGGSSPAFPVRSPQRSSLAMDETEPRLMGAFSGMLVRAGA